MLKDKNLIIIPGSCSAKTIWYDQVQFFKEHGFNVKYFKLPCSKETLHEASKDLFNRIWQHRSELAKASPQRKRKTENQTLKKELVSARDYLSEERSRELPSSKIKKEENVIICHSMGGMQLLNILMNKEYYSTLDEETYYFIEDSQIFFCQVPLKYRKTTIRLCRLMSSIFNLAMEWHIVNAYTRVDNFLFELKKKSHSKSKLFLEILDMLGVINHLSIFNAFLGTSPKNFNNLISYYENWNIYDSKPSGAKYIKDSISEKKRKRYFFSTGSPDAFCDIKRTEHFAHELGANLKAFPMSFHLPMHIPWTEDAFNHWVLDKSSS